MNRKTENAMILSLNGEILCLGDIVPVNSTTVLFYTNLSEGKYNVEKDAALLSIISGGQNSITQCKSVNSDVLFHFRLTVGEV